MQIDIGSLRGNQSDSLRVRFSVTTLPGLDWGESVVQLVPLSVEATVTNTGRSFLVCGEVRTELELQCDRCLRRFCHELAATLEEEYLPAAEAKAQRSCDTASPEADSQFAQENVFTGDVIDLAEAVREQAILALPWKKLCSNDCLGLCPICGKDLNKGDCSCERETIDPRMASLARLLEAGQRDSSGES